MAAPKKYPDELRERAVREVAESGRPIAHVARAHVARDLGIHPEALRNWMRQGEADRGERTDRATTSEKDELARLRREVAEFAPCQRDPQGGERIFRERARPSPDEVTAMIDDHKDRFGVEPICRVLQFPFSTYYARKTRPASARTLRDEQLLVAAEDRCCDDRLNLSSTCRSGTGSGWPRSV
jgi:transposase